MAKKTSIRTLFVIMSTVAIACVFFATKETVPTRLKRLGATIKTGPVWYSEQDFGVRTCEICGTDHCPHLRDKNNIEAIYFRNSKINDERLQAAAACPNLRLLGLRGCILEPDITKLHMFSGLEVLDVSYSHIGDESIDTICLMPNLRVIDVQKARFSAEGRKRLREAGNKLIVLNWYH
ncbi:MAG: hypothetical protein AAF483_26345 [Planctomycetota bacterium]